MIDLSGVENLVLDRNVNLRYLDSLKVFFLYTDLGNVIDLVDEELQERIEVSIKGPEYRERLVAAVPFSRAKAGAPRGREL